jgi:hypothetical protein
MALGFNRNECHGGLREPVRRADNLATFYVPQPPAAQGQVQACNGITLPIILSNKDSCVETDIDFT